MRSYAILTSVLLVMVSFYLWPEDDSALLELETNFNQRVQHLRSLIQKVVHIVPNQERHYPLTWVDFEDKIFLDKLAVERLLEKRFYGSPRVGPGVYELVVTGYSSTVAQCGPDPFITASGQRVRSGIVATNLLPIGTRIRIPEVFGNQVFEVQDRMAQRYWGRVDVWFPEYSQAIRFGVRRLKVEVL